MVGIFATVPLLRARRAQHLDLGHACNAASLPKDESLQDCYPDTVKDIVVTLADFPHLLTTISF
jgi:hypothetical protein